MENDWIEFKETGYELRRKNPRVVLTKEKIFRLNKKALELIGEPEAVRFLYDAGRRRIGIRSVEPQAPYAFRTRIRDKGQAGYVHGSQFCNRFGIRPEASIEFDSVRVDGDGTLILELNNARTVSPRFVPRDASPVSL